MEIFNIASVMGFQMFCQVFVPVRLVIAEGTINVFLRRSVMCVDVHVKGMFG